MNLCRGAWGRAMSQGEREGEAGLWPLRDCEAAARLAEGGGRGPQIKEGNWEKLWEGEPPGPQRPLCRSMEDLGGRGVMCT